MLPVSPKAKLALGALTAMGAVAGMSWAWRRRFGIDAGQLALPAKVMRGGVLVETSSVVGPNEHRLEQTPEGSIAFRGGAAASMLGDFKDLWIASPHNTAWLLNTSVSEPLDVAKSFAPDIKVAPAAEWLASAATAGYDVLVAMDANLSKPTRVMIVPAGDWVRKATPDSGYALFIQGQGQPDLTWLTDFMVPSEGRSAPRVRPVDAAPPRPTPKVQWLDLHPELRLGHDVNWALLKSLRPRVRFDGLTPEVLERYRTMPAYAARAGWTPGVFSGEKYFDSRYRKPANQTDLLYADGLGDRSYLLKTGRNGAARFAAMRNKVDNASGSVGEGMWQVLNGLIDVSATLNTRGAAFADQQLEDMRKFYANLVREAGKASKNGYIIVATQILGWVYEHFLKGAGDDKFRGAVDSSMTTIGYTFGLTLELGLPPILHIVDYPMFEGISPGVFDYKKGQDEITQRVDAMASVQVANLFWLLSLPKAARNVITTWWMLALEALGKDQHMRAAFATLMAGKAGVMNFACDEQVYLVGYSMAFAYHLDPTLFIPALWDAARGWSQWSGLASIGMAGYSDLGLAPNYQPNQQAWISDVTAHKVSPRTAVDVLEAMDIPLPDLGEEPVWYSDGSPLPTIVTEGRRRRTLVGYDPDYDGPARKPKSKGLSRTVQNCTALNWFDLCLAAFQLAEQRKLDWRLP